MSDNQRQSDGDPTRRSGDSRTTPDTTGPLSRRRFMQSTAVAGASALALGGASSAAGQSVAEQSCEGEFERFEVGGGDFKVMNNQWTSDATQQCIYAYDDGSYGWSFESPNAGPNYPEVWIGERPWGEDTEVPEFQGLQRGDVEELTMAYDVELDINSDAEWNLAMEWWLMDGEPNPDNPPHTHEIMLVLNHSDQHSHGAIQHDSVWTDQFGNTVHHWSDNVNGGTGARFHVFVLDTLSSQGTVDLAEITNYLTEEYGVREDLGFTGIEVGTEYWPGAAGEVTVNQLDVTINGSTYTSGPGGDTDPEPEPPTSPDDQWTNEVTNSTIDVGWSSVDAANEYTVYLDGSQETTTSSTSTTIAGLSPDTEYTIGIESVNDAGSSDRAETAVRTQQEDDEACEGAASSESLSNGQTVCDVDGDGEYMDVTGDGSVTNSDVTEFFGNQHVDPWDSRTEMFDFDGDGQVSQADVIELFEQV